MTQNQQTEHNSDTQYLNWLSKLFPTIAAACTEIINLEAILHLPKGTEHFTCLKTPPETLSAK